MTTLNELEARLRNGAIVPPIRVRSLLECFGVERRGPRAVEQIRSELARRGLVTEPDFESAWIDEPIGLRLAAAGAGAQNGHARDNGQKAAIAAVPAIKAEARAPDPAFRISSLAVANRPVVAVRPDDTLERAVTLMLQHDYAQLPILTEGREARGVVTWRSIAVRTQLGGGDVTLERCREEASVVEGSGCFLDLIRAVTAHGYALVRGAEGRVTGMVTASDLGAELEQIAEPFLLVREIELHVRQILGPSVAGEDLRGHTRGERPAAATLAEAGIGEYVLLLQRSDIWARLELKVDRRELLTQLERVRQIRDDLMHFDPDPLTAQELGELRSAAAFLRRLRALRGA